jgi:hypothetical protein
MYKLSSADTGLHCTANGLTYGGIKLVAKAGDRFQPCQPQIDRIASAGLTISPTGLQTIASFLNKGELGLAMIGALHLRLPDLAAMRLAKAGFDPNEARDDQGRWTSEDDRSSDNGARAPAAHPAGTQYADSSQTMNDATPAGPNTPTSSLKGHSNMDIDGAVDYLKAHAKKDPEESCAYAVRMAMDEGGGIDTTDHPVPAKDYGPYLEDYGFVAVPSDDMKNYMPQKGDVAVIQTYNGAKNTNGHIAMYTGQTWVSDFTQTHGNTPYPSFAYIKAGPKYVIYRP